MGTHGKKGKPRQKILGLGILKWKFQTFCKEKMIGITFHFNKIEYKRTQKKLKLLDRTENI
jgi:hypothetical protein